MFYAKTLSSFQSLIVQFQPILPIHGNDVYAEDLIFVGYPSSHLLPESLENYSENYLRFTFRVFYVHVFFPSDIFHNCLVWWTTIFPSSFAMLHLRWLSLATSPVCN